MNWSGAREQLYGYLTAEVLRRRDPSGCSDSVTHDAVILIPSSYTPHFYLQMCVLGPFAVDNGLFCKIFDTNYCAANHVIHDRPRPSTAYSK